MPTLNSYTHCQATEASRTNQSLSKSISEPTHEGKRKKHESTTTPIRNALRDTAHSQNVGSNMKNLTYIISILFFTGCSQPESFEDRQDEKQVERYSIEDFNEFDFDQDSTYNIKLTVDTIQGLTTFSLSFPEAEGKYSEQYYFNSEGNLISYFFYNDFQERNPLLMRIDLRNGLLDPDSIKIEGPPVCYRVQVTPTEEITYLKAASPTFLKGQIECTRLKTKGEPVELVNDSISVFHSFWALGKKDTYQTHESYQIITTLKMDERDLIQDTLKL